MTQAEAGEQTDSQPRKRPDGGSICLGHGQAQRPPAKDGINQCAESDDRDQLATRATHLQHPCFHQLNCFLNE